MNMESKLRKSIKSMRFENVSFGFEDRGLLIENNTVEFPMNKNIHLTGPAGAGKTTVLKIIAGLINPEVGKFLINSEDALPMSFEEFLPYRLNIGFSFDYGGLLANRTLFENLMLPLRYHELLSHTSAIERVDQILKDFGLTRNRDARPSAVSGGHRKATIVARAFVTQPEMIIFDQPTTGLDDLAEKALVRYIKEGRDQGWLKHVFIVSQDKELLSHLEVDSFVIFDKKVFSYEEFEKKVIYA
ncbi:MAG: ATP-binding cassette domain-containing protein [Pseudomonadota bacterium]|nr:ATP-binding cassette domain-containing protein [Pseudomonadota bacterium]